MNARGCRHRWALVRGRRTTRTVRACLHCHTERPIRRDRGSFTAGAVVGAAVAALVVVAAGLAAVHVGRAVDGVIRDVSARVQVARAATVDTGRARPAVPGAPIQPGGTGRGLVFDDPRVDVSRVDVRP